MQYRTVILTKEFTPMYRCHFTQCGRIVFGENIDESSLPEAVMTGYRLLDTMARSRKLDGFEIWQDERLLYASAGHTPRQ
ncbi:MAG TPA: hypothetical protein VGC09_00705 [Rhodopila sp.]